MNRSSRSSDNPDLREEGVENTLTSEQRVIRSMLLRYWSRCTDRPNLHHGMFRGLAIELCLQYDILRRWNAVINAAVSIA